MFYFKTWSFLLDTDQKISKTIGIVTIQGFPDLKILSPDIHHLTGNNETFISILTDEKCQILRYDDIVKGLRAVFPKETEKPEFQTRKQRKRKVEIKKCSMTSSKQNSKVVKDVIHIESDIPIITIDD